MFIRVDITDATSQLMFNPSNKEEGVITIMDIDDFKDSIVDPEKTYTKNSYDALTSAYDKLKALIELDKATPQEPDLFKEAVKEVTDSKNELISLGLLPTLIEEFENTNKDLYTTSSFGKYESAIQDSRVLLISGTESTISDAINDINDAKQGLTLQAALQPLKDSIQELEALEQKDYTEQSYKAMTDKVSEIKSDIETATQDQLAQYASELQAVKNKLVSIKALKSSVESAKAFDINKYTVSSYNALNAQITKAETLYQSATAEEVANSVSELDKAIRALKIRVNVQDYQAYIKDLAKEDSKKYTAESYKVYEDAYNVLLGLSKDLPDVSAEQFIQIKDNYEKALKDLKEKATSETGKTETSDMTNIVPFVVASVVALGVLALLRKKKNEKS